MSRPSAGAAPKSSSYRRLFELHATQDEMDHIWGLPLIQHSRAAFRSPSWRVKRLVDVLGAAAALLALSPVLLALSVAVYLEGGPGIIFRQTRVASTDVRSTC